MDETSGSRDRVRFGSMARLGVGLAVAILSAVIGYMWLEDHGYSRLLWRIKLDFLIGLEAAYGLALVMGLVGVPVLAVVLVRARRRRVSRPAVGRALLLGISTLFGLALAEGAAAVWMATEGPSGVMLA